MSIKRIGPITVFVLCAVLLCAFSAAALAEESNFYSTIGRFAYQDGYMYYIAQRGLTSFMNDGRETGMPYSVDIWRVADTPGAQPELVGFVPTAILEGIDQISAASLVSYGDAVYFPRLRAEDEGSRSYSLCRMDLNTGEYEDLAAHLQLRQLIPDGNLLYYSCIYNGLTWVPEPSIDWFVLDMSTGTISNWSMEELLNEYGYPYVGNLRRRLLTIAEGYIYYLDSNLAESRQSICRVPVTGGEQETVVQNVAVNIGSMRFFVQGNLFCMYDTDTLYCADMNAQALVEEIPLTKTDHVYGYAQFQRFNVADGRIYYLKEDGLYVKTPGEGQETLLISGETNDLTGLAIGENYVYMFRNDYNSLVEVLRVPLSASKMDSNESLMKMQQEVYTHYHHETQEEDGWLFAEYPNCVMIMNYTGYSTYAAVPAQIHGKPVVYVYLSLSEDQPLQALTIPEGVRRLGYLGDRRLISVSLPASLLYMECRGYPYVFGTADNCVVYYAGTKAEWEALCRYSVSDVGIGGNPPKNLLVICSDGAWNQVEVTPVPTATPAPTPTPTPVPTATPAPTPEPIIPEEDDWYDDAYWDDDGWDDEYYWDEDEYWDDWEDWDDWDDGWDEDWFGDWEWDPGLTVPESEDWEGRWTYSENGYFSDIVIEGDIYMGAEVTITFEDEYTFSGILVPYDDFTLDFYEDHFNCLLSINRETQSLLMYEIGCMVADVNDWLDNSHFSVIYHRAK